MMPRYRKEETRSIGDCESVSLEKVEIGEGFVRKENELRFGRIDLKKV